MSHSVSGRTEVIHSFIFSNGFILVRVTVDQESLPGMPKHIVNGTHRALYSFICSLTPMTNFV